MFAVKVVVLSTLWLILWV